MSTREQLAEVIRDGVGVWRTPLEAADAILAAGCGKPRTIATVAELDALPAETVVRDKAFTIVYEKFGDGEGGTEWLTIGDDRGYPATEIDLPATVLYSPEVEAIEAAAKALYQHNETVAGEFGATLISPPADEYDCCARAALEAAAPYVIREARAAELEAAAEHITIDHISRGRAAAIRAGEA